MAGKDYTREQVAPGVYKLVRDGSWVSTQVYYRVGRKQRVKTFSGPNTTTAAKRFKADLNSKQPEQRADPAAGRVTLAQVWDHQLANRAYSTKTLKGRADIRGKAGLSSLFATPVNKITRDMVTDAIDRTTNAPGMAREIRKSIRSALSHAEVAMGIEFPKGNPASSLKMRSTRAEAMAAHGENIKRVLSREEVQRLISEMPERYKALVELLARVGLRPGEAYGLRVRQVDPLAHTLLIDTAASGFTKTGKTRTIPIPADLSATLWDHIERYSDQMTPDALIFSGERGKPVEEHYWRRTVFRPASERAGVNHGLRPYDLRHTALSTALSLGIDPATVANMAGHDVRTLLSTYTHAMEEAKVRAADILGAAWNASGSTESIP